MQTLGPYQLLRKVGSGGMAEVWSARKANRVAGEKFVAIKILARHVAEEPRYREMFIAEARLSLALNHANIITVFDVIEDAGECYMVMELIEGMTLSQLVRSLGKRDEQLPLPVAVHIIAELLRALAYAHGLRTEQGASIVHRDVSPQNVMVTTAGEVKLMDFGIARFSTEETSGNLVKGKLQYMPPEQLSKRTREPTIDLFAVGGMLQELVEGKRFRGGVDQEVLLGMVFRGEVPAMTVELPEALEALRLQLLESDCDKRLGSAKQALAQIYDWSGYRNASLQLEELVCQFVEPASATSMPSTAIEVDEDDATIARDSGISAMLAPLVASTPSPELAPAPESAETPAPAEAAPAPPEAAPAPPERPTAIPVAVAVAGSMDAMVVGDELETQIEREIEDEVESDVDIDAHAGVTGGGQQADPELEILTGVDRPNYAFHAEPELLTREFSGRESKRWVAGGLVVAAIALFVLFGWGSGMFGGSTPTPKPAPQGDIQVVVAPAVVPEDTEGNQASEAGDTPEDTLAKDAEAPAPAPSPSKSEKAKPKVSVEFNASGFYFVYVKVAGHKLTLEPNKTVRLPVGNHAVYLRQKTSHPWKKAGAIRLSRGTSYKVEMKKPASLRLTKKN